MFLAPAFFSLLNACILFASGSKRNRGNSYLGFLFLLLALRGFASATAFVNLPKIYREALLFSLMPISLPLFFLIGPVIYFYFRYQVLGLSFTLKRDFKHLLVFLISVISLLPFYMSSYALKQRFINTVIKSQLPLIKLDFGIINSTVYLIGSPIHTLFYLTLSLYTISLKSQSLSNKLNSNSYEVLVNYLYAILKSWYALAISNLIFTSYWILTGVFSPFLPIITGIIFLYLNIQLYKHPQILFGIKFSRATSTFNLVHISKSKPIIPKDISLEIQFNQKLDQYRLGKEFVTSDFTMEFIATDLEISEYVLKDYFKNTLKLKFIDFRNELRIAHFNETITKADFSTYTLSAIANQYGFSTINSLKKTFDACQSESYEAFHSKLMKN